MFENEKVDKQTLFIIVLLIVLSTDFFRFSYFFSSAVTKIVSILLHVILCGIILSKIKKIDVNKMRFSKGLLLIIVLSLCSSLSAYIIFRQSFFDSLRTNFFTMGFLIPYWFLHVKHTNEKTVMMAFVYSALFILFIQVYQQLFPEHALWGLISDEEEAWDILERTKRNDLYRFRIGFNGVFTYPVLFHAWEKVLKKIKSRYILLFLLMCTSIYLNLTRQLMFATIVVLILSFFISRRGANKTNIFIVLLLVGLGLVKYGSVLMGDLFQTAYEQANDETYVRFLSYSYFWQNSYDSFLSVLFGHGLSAGNSGYAQLRESLHLSNINASDVGFVGAFYNWGYLHVLIFFYFVTIVWRNRFKMSSYVLLYFLVITITTIMIWPLLQVSSILAVSLMLYLCDLKINNYERL